MNFEMEEDRDLTACEAVIMKAVWEAEEDLSVMELRQILRNRFGKDYAPTTVRTFLVMLSDKGFVRTYRIKKNAYVHALKDEKAYKAAQLQKQADFWYNGSAADLICTMFQASTLSREERDKIRGYLDDWDHELDV
ncbi:MAG: BlaI/MecI/CopY family transcriptional regulator [Lachnospiraceae bacterium]|jgi:predicted transcriptional regulator|nr:BlaI/MecI/CopY family transcriptional regulator [Lachnospiraceae bacterium]MCI9150379.1 BlaI/MecI/CopY family transcriptional regulator [Lachnospiraceae bacterium]